MTDVVARLAPAFADRYSIERELGSGGMATVYLAEDVRHHRKVAIKVLHPELSAVLGPDRFLKEIELTANLQHPHILPLFDSGSADGLLYYVMPYVEGETLRGLLSRERQLAIPVAIRIATEVADALDYAHRRKVIHRDIKPENVLLHDGRALVADFGIALAVQHAGGTRMTQTGMSLGTPQYMAPEQAMGDRAVDSRADIYALGAVAYEMLSGEPPFTGPSAQAIVAKVMTERPRPLREARDTVPRNVADTIGAALQKLPADRPATAAAFATGLATTSTTQIADEPSARGFDRRIATAAALAMLAIGGLAGFLIRATSAREEGSRAVPSRLSMLAPAVGGTGLARINGQIALTPDGSAVVYVTLASNGGNVLAYQRLDASSPTMLPGTEGMFNPIVSPDGASVAGSVGSVYEDSTDGRRVSIAGGQVMDMPAGVRITPNASWTSEGSLWFEGTNNGGVAVRGADGRVTRKLGGKASGLIFQQLMSDGRTALMIRAPVGAVGASTGPALLVDVETGVERALVDLPVVSIRYTAGYLLYAQGTGVMWALRFDEKSGHTSGAPVQLATDVAISIGGGAQVAVAPNGTVAYIPEEPRSLVFADRQGQLRPATPELRSFHAPTFSPDGRRVALDLTGSGGRDVWILSLTQGTLSRATFAGDGHDPTWAPGGRAITYATFRNGNTFGLYRVRPGSAATPDSLLVSGKLGYTGAWLPDGAGLVTTGSNLLPGSGSDIVLVSNGGRGPIVPLVASAYSEQYPAISPNGRWLAFTSDQTGTNEVYVRPLSGDGDVVQVSQSGGTEPVWADAGGELFYRSGSDADATLMSASVTTTQAFDVLSRRKLFAIPDIESGIPHANYDISPDGQTFVMVRRSRFNRIVVLQNLPQLVARIRDAAGQAR